MRYITKETRDWRAVIRAQAIAYKPDVLPLGAVRMAVEFVLPRPKYLMAPRYYHRCKSRKCKWTGQTAELVYHGFVGVVCPKCHADIIKALPTPPHTVKPDVLDNLMKPLADSLKGLFYADDAQVNEAGCKKRWAAFDEQPHVSIEIETGGES